MKKFNIKLVKYYLSLIISVSVFLTGCANTTTNVNNSSSQSNTNSSIRFYWTPNGKSYYTTKIVLLFREVKLF